MPLTLDFYFILFTTNYELVVYADDDKIMTHSMVSFDIEYITAYNLTC